MPTSCPFGGFSYSETMNNVLQSLAGLFGSKPPTGSGMVDQAAQILQSRPYQLYAQEAQALGQQPMPPDQWLKMTQSQQMGQQASGGLLGQ